MCVFFPLVLGLMAGIWAFPVSAAVGLGWDLLWAVALGLLIARMRRPPNTLNGVPVSSLPGRPCPACGSQNTQVWMSGRTPLGVHCAACDRRTPGLP